MNVPFLLFATLSNFLRRIPYISCYYSVYGIVSACTYRERRRIKYKNKCMSITSNLINLISTFPCWICNGITNTVFVYCMRMYIIRESMESYTVNKIKTLLLPMFFIYNIKNKNDNIFLFFVEKEKVLWFGEGVNKWKMNNARIGKWVIYYFWLFTFLFLSFFFCFVLFFDFFFLFFCF